MSGIKGLAKGISTINKLKAAIKETPLRIRRAVALEAEEILTRKIREAFAAGQTVYETPRPVGVEGNFLTLVGGRTEKPRKRYNTVKAAAGEDFVDLKAARARFQRLDAYRSRGHVKDGLAFVAIGTLLRARLNQPYARFLVGKYKILPMSLPPLWQEELEKMVADYRADFEREVSR